MGFYSLKSMDNHLHATRRMAVCLLLMHCGDPSPSGLCQQAESSCQRLVFENSNICALFKYFEIVFHLWIHGQCIICNLMYALCNGKS